MGMLDIWVIGTCLIEGVIPYLHFEISIDHFMSKIYISKKNFHPNWFMLTAPLGRLMERHQPEKGIRRSVIRILPDNMFLFKIHQNIGCKSSGFLSMFELIKSDLN